MLRICKGLVFRGEKIAFECETYCHMKWRCITQHQIYTASQIRPITLAGTRSQHALRIGRILNNIKKKKTFLLTVKVTWGKSEPSQPKEIWSRPVDIVIWHKIVYDQSEPYQLEALWSRPNVILTWHHIVRAAPNHCLQKPAICPTEVGMVAPRVHVGTVIGTVESSQQRREIKAQRTGT